MNRLDPKFWCGSVQMAVRRIGERQERDKSLRETVARLRAQLFYVETPFPPRWACSEQTVTKSDLCKHHFEKASCLRITGRDVILLRTN